jgi:hypothetical protein
VRGARSNPRPYRAPLRLIGSTGSQPVGCNGSEVEAYGVEPLLIVGDAQQAMRATFYLIDLVAQCAAVERLLTGVSEAQKIDWLSAHGRLARFPKEDGPQVFHFTSRVGLEARFFSAMASSYFWESTPRSAQTRSSALPAPILQRLAPETSLAGI